MKKFSLFIFLLFSVSVGLAQTPSTIFWVDFGPNDITNGNITVSPDTNGNYWNNVIDGVVGGDTVYFVDNANNPTGAYFTVTSHFATNGILNGGLLDPDPSLLGEFAIATATQDYFFEVSSAAFKISGFDDTRPYTFYFFGTRNSTEVRITEYKVEGTTTSTVSLQTSGPDLGGPGYNGNNSTIVNSTPVMPQNGEINVTITTLAGSFCYLGVMKIEAGDPTPVELTSFTSFVDESDVMLSWITATETNNSGFHVERSTKGSEYVDLGFVAGHGTTTETQEYSFIDQNVVAGKYNYRLKQIDFDGTINYSKTIEVEVLGVTEFSLDQNYPNPFNPSTKINFRLASDSKVSFKIFDMLGQEVATLVNRQMTSGSHSVSFDGSSLNSGVYFYRIEASGIDGQEFISVKKMILTK